MGRTIDSRRTCEKIGSDPWYGENTFNVDVAPFVVDVVNPTARAFDLSGGWNEAVCALLRKRRKNLLLGSADPRGNPCLP